MDTTKHFRGLDMIRNKSEILCFNELDYQGCCRPVFYPEFATGKWTIVLGRYNQIVPQRSKISKLITKMTKTRFNDHNSRIVDPEDAEIIVLHGSTKSDTASY